MAKKPNVQERAPLIPIDATFPFEMVSIDFLHLDRCKGGYEYALIRCDHFTRFVQIYPTKNKSAKAAAEQIFNKFIMNYGFPLRIHHDQGREFNNQLFSRLHSLSGISASRTTPYHAMGDGQPERMNRTLLNMLKCLSKAEKLNWKDHVTKLAFAYNSTVNKTTGFSPFFLMFGRESRLPIDLIFGIEITGSRNKVMYNDFVKEWKESMQQAISIAQKHIDTSKRYNEKHYNRKIRGTDLAVGDKVLLRNNKERGGTGKLRCHWEDHIYEVVEKDDKLPVYSIKPYKSSKTATRVHRNNLMACNHLLPDKETAERKKKVTKKLEKKKKSSSSSEDEFIVVRHFSSGGEEGLDEMTDIPAPPPSGEMSEIVDEPEISWVDDVVEEIQEEAETEEVADDEVSSSTSSSDSERMVRRSCRNRCKPQVFTYNEIGGDPSHVFR